MGDNLPARSPRDLGRENRVLRELVTVYRQLSGLALQDAGLASVAQLLADRTAATVAVVTPVMDVMAAAAPGAELAGAEELELELQAVATPVTRSDTTIAETRLGLPIGTTLSGITG